MQLDVVSDCIIMSTMMSVTLRCIMHDKLRRMTKPQDLPRIATLLKIICLSLKRGTAAEGKGRTMMKRTPRCFTLMPSMAACLPGPRHRGVPHAQRHSPLFIRQTWSRMTSQKPFSSLLSHCIISCIIGSDSFEDLSVIEDRQDVW